MDSPLSGVHDGDATPGSQGTARFYLSALGELPERELVAAVPISLRAADHGTLTTDNQFTIAAVAWGTDIHDPGERLLHIHKSAASGKRRVRASGENAIATAGAILSPGVLHALMRFVAPLAGEYSHVYSLSVSTLQATPFPLFIAGARLEAIYPMTVLYPGQGLAITAVTYNGRVYLGFTFAPELVPQPWLLPEGIEKSLAMIPYQGIENVGRGQVRSSACFRSQTCIALREEYRPTRTRCWIN